jgi:imidazoleglycerol phosphate synthase glutamine amidotransferase subunit HisH
MAIHLITEVRRDPNTNEITKVKMGRIDSLASTAEKAFHEQDVDAAVEALDRADEVCFEVGGKFNNAARKVLQAGVETIQDAKVIPGVSLTNLPTF